MKKVLMVCTGNTCRSVMAEVLFRLIAAELELKVEVGSAGIAAFTGDAPASHAASIVNELGGDVSSYRARVLSSYLVEEADLILAMTKKQKEEILLRFPEACSKVYLLKAYPSRREEDLEFDVADPFSQSLSAYEKTAKEMDHAIRNIVEDLKGRWQKVERIVVGSDHGAFFLKEEIKNYLSLHHYEVCDLGTFSEESCDYPDIALPLAKKVSEGEYTRGILLCGTGIGMSMVANKVKGIRAALCHDVFSATMTRAHNDSNILCMGARVIGLGHALMIVERFLSTAFEGGRHEQRLAKFDR